MRLHVIRLLLAASLVSLANGASAQNVGINATGAAPAASAIITVLYQYEHRPAGPARGAHSDEFSPAGSSTGRFPSRVQYGHCRCGTEQCDAGLLLLGRHCLGARARELERLADLGKCRHQRSDQLPWNHRQHRLRRAHQQPGTDARAGGQRPGGYQYHGADDIPRGIKPRDRAGRHLRAQPQCGGTFGREINFSFGIPVQTVNGAGIYASNPTAGYTSAFAQSTGADFVAANISYSDVWMASYNYVQNGSALYNPSANYNQLNVTNAGLGGTHIALRGWSERGTTAGNPGYTVGVQGIANTQFQDAIAVQGISFTNAPVRVGGYFEGLSYAGGTFGYAYVGGTLNGVTVNKIVGLGAVGEVVPTAEFMGA